MHVAVDAWRVTAHDYEGRELSLRHALHVRRAEGLHGHAVQIHTSYGAPFYVLETKTPEEAEAVLRWLSRALLVAKGEIHANTTTHQPGSGLV